jgi:Uma2 family endonuclease
MLSSVTQAAEGFPRRAFSVAEVFRMQEIGVLREDERFELIEGEIVPLGPKSGVHEGIRLPLIRALARAFPDNMLLGASTSFYLSDFTVLEPDLSIFPMMDTTKVRGPDVVLVIEVADTTLEKDMRLKARLYAKYGVRELWVIDANRRETHVHRDPVEGEWSNIEILGPEHLLSHASAPGFAVRLAEL